MSELTPETLRVLGPAEAGHPYLYVSKADLVAHADAWAADRARLEAAERVWQIMGGLIDHLHPAYKEAWRELGDALAREHPGGYHA